MNPNQFPARFKLSGSVLNVFQAPAGKTREGTEYGGDYRVQLLSTDTLKNGEQKVVQTEVSIGTDAGRADRWKQALGEHVTVAAAVYAINGDIRVQLANQNVVPARKQQAAAATPAATPDGEDA